MTQNGAISATQHISLRIFLYLLGCGSKSLLNRNADGFTVGELLFFSSGRVLKWRGRYNAPKNTDIVPSSVTEDSFHKNLY